MGKILFFLLIAVIIWWLVKGLSKAPKREPPAARSPIGEDMVKCARCGVNMPRSEAREDSGSYYCVNNPHCHA